MELTPAEALKRQAAERALEYVESGMVLGLGTGSTLSLIHISEPTRPY